ncbi:preprotein translocase subunit SecE [Candidatus Roizmanbacteria bacterium]|nr:preprotein translocase subunit SecE [Candidatus Roizmanbacteria bacterium]
MKQTKALSNQWAAGITEELKKVTWPSRQDTIRLTMIVILISLIIGMYIGIIDVLLAKALELITKSR